MRGIRSYSLQDLTSNLRYEGMLGAKNLNTLFNERVEDSKHNTYKLFLGTETSRDYLLQELIERDGVVAVQYVPDDVMTESHRRVAKSYLRGDSGGLDDLIIKATARHHDITLNDVHGMLYENLAGLITTWFKKTARLDKHNVGTISGVLDLRRKLFDCSIPQDEIKRVMTIAKAVTKPLHLYRTHCFIECHYAELSDALKLKTCMTKGYGDFDDCEDDAHFCTVPHPAMVEDTEGRRIQVFGDSSGVFTANVEGFNGCTDFALFLISPTPPDEIENVDHYPFIGRFIVGKGADGEFNIVTRVYGQEHLERSIMEDKRFIRGNYLGLRHKVFVSHKTVGRYKNKPVFVMPYLDGDYNAVRVDMSVPEYDEIGRTFYWATVQPYHKYSFDPDDVPSDDSHSLYFLNQKSWISEEGRWGIHATCPFTGEELNSHNGIYNYHIDQLVRSDYKDRTELEEVSNNELLEKFNSLQRKFENYKQHYQSVIEFSDEFRTHLPDFWDVAPLNKHASHYRKLWGLIEQLKACLPRLYGQDRSTVYYCWAYATQFNLAFDLCVAEPIRKKGIKFGLSEDGSLGFIEQPLTKEEELKFLFTIEATARNFAECLGRISDEFTAQENAMYRLAIAISSVVSYTRYAVTNGRLGVEPTVIDWASVRDAYDYADEIFDL